MAGPTAAARTGRGQDPDESHALPQAPDPGRRLSTAPRRRAGQLVEEQSAGRGGRNPRQNAASFWAESTRVGPARSDAGDVCSEEVDAVSVEVATGAVVVLGGAGVRVAGEDLGVTQGDARVQGVGDRGVP